MFNDAKNVTSYQCFWFNKDWKGKVKVRKSVNDEFEMIGLLKTPIASYTFDPRQLEIPGLKMIKQEGLYTKVRPFIPEAFKDILCHRPTVVQVEVEPESEMTERVEYESNPTVGEAVCANVIVNLKKRRIPNADEIGKLTSVFSINPNPDKQTLETLALDLGWDIQRVSFWLGNKRKSKMSK
eukprot:NODE_62_length_25126_cov_0.447277.p9 type:complete len:182 gc:universal NODE_62_length_25126_cov_0.447277:18142-18687(+)